MTSAEETEAEAVRRQIPLLLPDLRAFARFLVRDRAEADDLVQEAVLRALDALDQFHADNGDRQSRVRAWLFTILRNVFYESARRRKREAAALRHGAGDAVSAEAQQPTHVDLADLERMLWRLTPLLREALVLVGAQGLSHEEAAAICKVPVGTIKARVSRARAQLAAVRADTSRENDSGLPHTVAADVLK